MYGKLQQHLQKELADIKEAGLYKSERIIVSEQDAEITLNTGKKPNLTIKSAKKSLGFLLANLLNGFVVI
jgi:hypothetical protein